MNADLAAILTGGAARRMGGEKVRMELGGVPLVERVRERMRGCADRVICVGGESGLETDGVETVPDLFPGADSLGGIATGLEYAARTLGDRARVVCVACDMPFIEPALVRALVARCADHDIAVPRTTLGFEPFCAVYRAGAHAAFAAQIRDGNLRIRDVFRQLDTLEVDEGELRRFDPPLHSFLNVNRPEELAVAEQVLRDDKT